MRQIAIFLIGVAMMTAVPAWAQEAAVPAAVLEDWFAEGRAALDAADPEAALDPLEDAIEADPAYVSLTHGAVALWLGRAYLALGDPGSAVEVWKAGLAALAERGRFDAPLADAFIAHTFAETHAPDYPEAVNAYLGLLATLDTAPSRVPAYHLEALAAILPGPMLAATGLAAEGAPPARLAPDAGTRLITWFRSKDPAPATRKNERIEAHLQRLAYVQAHYTGKEGLDDRGKVYLRLGEPNGRTEVNFSRTAFREKVLRRNLTLSESDFPDNELWVYEHLGPDAQFLFVDRGGYYVLGEPNNLIPAVLRNGINSAGRGQAKAEAAIRAMEEIYRQLSLWHPLFSNRYIEVTDYVGQLDGREISDQLDQFQQAVLGSQEESVDEGAEPSVQQELASRAASGASGGAFPLSAAPHVFAQSTLMQANAEDTQAAFRREDNVPRDFVDVLGEAEELPLFVRTARFLGEDGSTRTEIYWGTAAGGVLPSEKMKKRLQEEGYGGVRDFLLLGAVIQKEAAYEERVVNYHRHLFRAVGMDGGQVLQPQTYTTLGDTGIYHLALQWDQYVASVDAASGQAVSLGPHVKSYIHRVDTLVALSDAPGQLEMSDLKPMLVAETTPGPPEALGDPYPYARITPTTPLALYFEAYHLTFGPDDQTHYTVEVEVVRDPGARAEKRTSARTAYTGDSRTGRDVLFLDLRDWQGDGVLDIRVRLTDETTGQTVERAIGFELAS